MPEQAREEPLILRVQVLKLEELVELEEAET